MKALLLLTLIAVSGVVLTGCSKKNDCGCAPPPQPDTHWKLTNISILYGTGESEPLTAEQLNCILTLKGERYTLKNQQSGATINGTISITPVNAFDNDKRVIMTFKPALDMMPAGSKVVNQYTSEKLVLGPGPQIADGPVTTFTRVENPG